MNTTISRWNMFHKSHRPRLTQVDMGLIGCPWKTFPMTFTCGWAHIWCRSPSRRKATRSARAVRTTHRQQNDDWHKEGPPRMQRRKHTGKGQEHIFVALLHGMKQYEETDNGEIWQFGYPKNKMIFSRVQLTLRQTTSGKPRTIADFTVKQSRLTYFCKATTQVEMGTLRFHFI